MAKKKEKLIIIDGHALLHRSFHALPPTLTLRDGTLVNAVYGFTAVLLKVLNDIKPDYIAVTFDKAKKTFRDKIYKEYKAHRVKAPQELYDQIDMIKDIVESFDIPIYELDGYEADDVIGTICKNKDVEAIESLIVTGDMDTLQLVDNNTKVLTLKKGINDTIIYDTKAVKERYDGLTPEQVIDYKAIKGDPSDNIPGVMGIGDKGAIELLKEFKTLENIYKNINSKKIKDSLRKKLIEHKKDAFMSKELATIVTDAPVKFKLKDTSFHEYSKDKVYAAFQRYEFKTLLNRLPKDKGYTAVTTKAHAPKGKKETVIPTKYTIVTGKREFSSFIKKLKTKKEFVFDTEATALDPFSATLLGISFSWKAGEAYYVVVADVQGEGLFEQITINKDYIKELKAIFEDSSIKKIAHNIKFDAQMLHAAAGIDVRNQYFDTMIASYILNPGSRAHGLDALSFQEFGHTKIKYEDLVGTGKNQIALSQVPIGKVGEYSCEDADFTYRLYELFSKELRSEKKLHELFETIEMPLVPVLERMELAGVAIDELFLKSLSREFDKTISELTKRIYRLAGTEFNIASPLQLKEVLFQKLHISSAQLGTTKTGISTAAGELEKIKDQHEIIPLILEYREITKLKSTYVDAIPELVNKKTGRVHTSFNQTITATGRLSSSDPNFQNIPVRTELGNQIRKAIVPKKGYKIISADYSQFELRIVAHLANDKHMIAAFKERQDIHAATAAKIHNIPIEKVTKEMRSAAKEVNFGVLYGMGPFGLALRTGISRKEAKEFIDKYFSVYSGIKTYVDAVIEEARKKGYAETMYGRRRYLPDIDSKNHGLRSAAERMAINMPIQGSQADILKLAMIEIDRKLPDISPKSLMMLQVHDELVFEVPAKDVQKVAHFVEKEMEGIVRLKVPIEVNVEAGDNWGELETLIPFTE